MRGEARAKSGKRALIKRDWAVRRESSCVPGTGLAGVLVCTLLELWFLFLTVLLFALTPIHSPGKAYVCPRFLDSDS